MNKKSVCLLTQEFRKGATWVYCSNIAAEIRNDGDWEPYIVAASQKETEESGGEERFSLKLIKTSSSKFFYSRDFWKKSLYEVKKINPTFVHGNMNLLSSYGIKNHYPIIETVHTTFSREKRGAKEESFSSLSWVEKRALLLYPVLRRIEAKLLHRAKHIIAVSDTIRSELESNYSIDENKISVIPNGVDTKIHQYSEKRIYEKEENELVLGFLGRMTASKGGKILFPILEKVKEKIPKVKLLIAGDDLGSRKEIINLISKYNLKNNIVDYGYIYDNEKKNSFFSSLDLFLLPSSHEGMNLTLLEALACQTPVLATPGAVTFDHDGVIAITSRNISDFVEKIIEFYENPKLSENFKKKSIEVSSRYSWKRAAKLVQTVYEENLP
ncbi:MAG: glycosyltransferase family 4 protein [Candidatus Heimdallarchaeota archaeon]|nr:glycosyltransferase family 4 protein [Candidatus Heimdallarchaeota archaeon]MCK4953786.1 glycosyltransferase family 4 protein [Candidatus Heimdallarchaeota archaeon]